jgi:hypothetical protein
MTDWLALYFEDLTSKRLSNGSATPSVQKNKRQTLIQWLRHPFSSEKQETNAYPATPLPPQIRKTGDKRLPNLLYIFYLCNRHDA